tara:strand:+ start:19 stop:609 length:591 start_codon:yes stop_codon:yes gene_type:complete
MTAKETKPKKRVKQHYVDNKKLLQSMIEYREMISSAKNEGKPRPRVPSYIGECIMKISQHLSYRPNFINYTYKDDMISDGIENCLLYIDNFNPEKSKNPFAYFTQIIYYAFIRRIQKEKKQTYVKFKSFEQASLMLDLAGEGKDSGSNPVNQNFLEFIHNNMDEFLADFEKTQRNKKEKRKKSKENADVEENLKDN